MLSHQISKNVWKSWEKLALLFEWIQFQFKINAMSADIFIDSCWSIPLARLTHKLNIYPATAAATPAQTAIVMTIKAIENIEFSLFGRSDTHIRFFFSSVVFGFEMFQFSWFVGAVWMYLYVTLGTAMLIFLVCLNLCSFCEFLFVCWWTNVNCKMNSQ